MMNKAPRLPGKPESCWVATAPATNYPRYEESGRVDVAIVGGGIVGLTAAYLLTRAGGWRVSVGRHHLDAGSVVLATHIPMWTRIAYDQRMRARCHTVMAFRAVSDDTIDGMFIDVDRPSHSLRMGRDADGPLLIVLGPSFPSGSDGDVAARFEHLESWVRSNVPAGEVVWRWVNEDYDTEDGVPYAGALTGEGAGTYVATGFNGWGISNGTAAAMLIADEIRGETNPWRRLYDPRRRAPKDFNPGGDTKSRVQRVDEIAPGTGGVIGQGKQTIAVWKDAQGTAHAFSAACTHKGCTVTWNNADRTWDCPCHGSMFSCDGRVIHGPATEPLEPARLAF